MALVKPAIPKGTRDFSPEEVRKRNYIFSVIKNVYEKNGYEPIETPAMENLETLLGKYGDEGDKLLFKILNSGQKANTKDWEKAIAGFLKEKNLTENFSSNDLDELEKEFYENFSGKGLRYDLTVPFARYVVMHQNEITFPFKRYQIQPVFRADRPQKGRYREFYQCDADVIGSDSLLYEVEIIRMLDEVFHSLKIPVVIKFNNRKILEGIAELIGKKEKFLSITNAIDKLDKIGIDEVKNELLANNLSEMESERVLSILSAEGSAKEKVNYFINIFNDSPSGKSGLNEVNKVLSYLAALPELKNQFEFDLSLARGLNYYTGAIFEVKTNAGSLKTSLAGGGRYDDLTGVFGLKGMSGIGISFGADRIYDVIEELKLFPEEITSTTKAMIVNFGSEEEIFALQLLAKLQANEISSELYPDSSKLKKQMDFANKKKISFVILAGSEEIKSEKLTLKNMLTGEQEKLSVEEIIDRIKE
jgi:histidyl-tRNA synthetase